MFFEKDLYLVLPFLFILMFFIINIVKLKAYIKKQRKYFINTLGHDFRVSVIAQIRALELIKKNYSPELLDNIKETSENSLDMITTLMEIYKLENQEATICFEEIKLSNIKNKIIQKLEPLINDKKLKITMDIGTDFAYADKYYLSKALILIFSVIIRHSENDSEIKISITKKGKLNEFVLSYTGIPLSEEEQLRMKEGASCFSTVGHGMRMYLFKKIIDFHNGSIKIVRNKNINKFIFLLPNYLQKNKRKFTKPLQRTCFEKCF